MSIEEDISPVKSSGNLFRDHELPDAELEHLRASLAGKIVALLDEEGLTAREAQKLTGIADTDFSRIRRVKLDRFTIDRLVTILARLGQEINFDVHPRPGAVARPAHPVMP